MSKRSYVKGIGSALLSFLVETSGYAVGVPVDVSGIRETFAEEYGVPVDQVSKTLANLISCGHLVHSGRNLYTATESGYVIAVVSYLKAQPVGAPSEALEPEATLVEEVLVETPRMPQEARSGKKVENETAKFLNRRLRETGGFNGSFMAGIKRAVSKKLPVSQTVGLVDDHVQNCFMKLISRDAFAKRLAEGYAITDQQVAMFAVRMSYTDIRDAAIDPVCRELYGARTERERVKGVGEIPESHDKRVIWSSGEDSTESGWLDIVDEAASPEDAIAFSQIMSQLENTIRSAKPHAAQRYIDLMHAKANGASLKEIAESEDVGEFRAAALIGELRKVVRASGKMSDFLN